MKASGNRINFAGKFADDSTQDDWWWKPNGVKESIAEYVDPETKEFAFHWYGRLKSLNTAFYQSKISELYCLPNTKRLKEFKNTFNSSQLTSFDLQLDLTSVESFYGCFKNCKALKSVDFTRVKTSNKVKDLGDFFCESSCGYIDLRSMDLSGAAGMYSTFRQVKAIVLMDNFGSCENMTSLYWTFRDADFHSTPERREACVYTFIEHSFDRRAVGYPDFHFADTHAPFFSKFTTEELEILNSKGYFV